MNFLFKYFYFLLFIIFNKFLFITSESCIICENYGFAKSRGINPIIIKQIQKENDQRSKRYVDPTFYGHPKTKSQLLARKFNTDNKNLFDQTISLIVLLNKISIKYLHKCPPYIFYDEYVEKSDSLLLQNLFRKFPITFFHGKINEKYQLENRFIRESNEVNCRSYILFLSDPLKTRSILGPQTGNRVIIVARSSQWKVREFLASELSSDIMNLLVISESLTTDPSKERPYVLYTHKLYIDGLGSNIPVVLTSWVRGVLTRPHVNLFPPKLKKGFSGHRFTVVAVNQPPFIFRRTSIDFTGTLNVKWEGVEYRLLELLSQRLNFSFDIREPRFTDRFGSGDAIHYSVQSGQADIGMAGVYVTEEHLKEIDMSVGHSVDCAAFITLASRALPKYRAIMGPFQWPVWVSLTVVYFVGIFPLAFSDRLSLRHLIGNWGEVENMFWYVFGTFTNSLSFTGTYSWSNSKKMSTRLLIGFYWIFTIIITACYTGSIIAFVTLPSFPETADRVTDLLGLFFRVGTLENGGWERWFLNSTDPHTIKLFAKMEYVNNIEEGIGNVTRSWIWNYAFLGSTAQLKYVVQSNFSTEVLGKRSALHLSEECFVPYQVGYTFPPNSVYSNSFNEQILRAQQSGLVNKILNEVSWIMQRSSTGRLLQASAGSSLREVIQEERQLTTADTEGMFLLLGVGYLMGALALGSEIIGGFSNKCRQIIKRTRKSVSSSFSSKRESVNYDNPDEMAQHLERKAIRQKQYQDNKPKRRFPGLNELNLTKATLREIYGGGGSQNHPAIVFQKGKYMFENETKSEDSCSSSNFGQHHQHEGDFEGYEPNQFEAMSEYNINLSNENENQTANVIFHQQQKSVDEHFGESVILTKETKPNLFDIIN